MSPAVIQLSRKFLLEQTIKNRNMKLEERIKEKNERIWLSTPCPLLLSYTVHMTLYQCFFMTLLSIFFYTIATKNTHFWLAGSGLLLSYTYSRDDAWRFLRRWNHLISSLRVCISHHVYEFASTVGGAGKISRTISRTAQESHPFWNESMNQTRSANRTPTVCDTMSAASARRLFAP